MTNQELIKEIKKPGKVYADVQGADDCMRLAIEKSDLLQRLQGLIPTELAMFTVETDCLGYRFLCSQEA